MKMGPDRIGALKYMRKMNPDWSGETGPNRSGKMVVPDRQILGTTTSG